MFINEFFLILMLLFEMLAGEIICLVNLMILYSKYGLFLAMDFLGFSSFVRPEKF